MPPKKRDKNSSDDQRERPSQEDTPMADIPPWLEQLINAQSKQKEKMLETLTLKSQEQENRFAKERLIDKFPVIRDTDNVEFHLQSFENEMQQIDVPQDRWKALLTIHLTPKMKAYVCDLQKDPMSRYEYMKACLLANAGMSRANASQKLFTLTWGS